MAGVGVRVNLGSAKKAKLHLEYNYYDVSLLVENQSNWLGSFVYRF